MNIQIVLKYARKQRQGTKFPPLFAYINRTLFHFLLQIVKNLRIKKFRQADSQTVAYFFNGGNSWIFAVTVYNVIECRLRNAANGTQLINSKIVAFT